MEGENGGYEGGNEKKVRVGQGTVQEQWCPRDSRMLVCHSPRDHLCFEDTTKVTA